MNDISSNGVDKLRHQVAGDIVTPESDDYDEVRALWNAMIDRRPAVIVRCANASDVPPAIAFAREHDLEIAIRGAGHNIAGNALCDEGLVIDFSNMRDVRVDAPARKAYVQPGATLADLDKATQAHALATPVGINSTTGIAGLTLGGGFGWLSRKHGLTIDNLVSADVVTADGRQLKASEDENEDLFWAIRGGGGNFGAVTRFEFDLHPVGPEVLAGLIVFPFDQAHQVLTQYRDFVESAPEELNAWVVLRQAPPLPFLPEDVHGKEVVVLAVFYAGDVAKGQELTQPLVGFGDPHGVHVGPVPYTEWQQAFDPLLTPGARNYWKTHNFTELSDDALDAMIVCAQTLPTPHCELFIGLLSGAGNRVPSDATAYVARDLKFVMNLHGRWEDPADDEEVIGWSRECFKAIEPFASGTAYVNFMTGEEGDRVSAAYGDNYARLSQLKARFDPENVFHYNQNIKPAG